MSGWWKWFYVATMAGGVLFFLRWRADPKGVPLAEYRVALAVPLWSGLWYAFMALGGGGLDDGHLVNWARYADWVVSAPLLLIALGLTATHSLPHRHTALMTALVGTNVVVILSGFLADLAGIAPLRYGLFALGSLALLAVLVLIHGPLRAVARRQPDGLYHTYREAALALSVLWIGYPVIWLLGPAGVGRLDDTTDTALFVLLSILSKVGWSILDIGRLRALATRDELPLGEGP